LEDSAAGAAVKRLRYQQTALLRDGSVRYQGSLPCPTHPVRLCRYTTAAALIVAGIFNTIAFAVWPWGRDGTEAAFVQAVTGSSSAGEIGPLLLHYGFVALAAGLLGLLEMLRPGPAAWGHLAGVLAFIGVVSFLPSAQIFWFLRAADAAGVSNTQLAAVAGAYSGGMAEGAIIQPAVFVTLVAIPVFLLALWRSGVVSWWPAAVMFTGMAVPVFLPYGALFPTLAAAVQAVALIYIGLQMLDRSDPVREALTPRAGRPARRKGTQPNPSPERPDSRPPAAGAPGSEDLLLHRAVGLIGAVIGVGMALSG
jgi:hypothetical protein